MKSQKERNGGEKNIDFFNFYYICTRNRADYKMEEKALQEIYKEHYRSLCFYASKYVEDMEDAKAILEGYLATYDHNDDQSGWFEKIRTMAAEMGYAAKPKDYKKHPEEYKGHVGHVSTVIRIAVMGRSQSPDVWEIQQILGEERTVARIKAFKDAI